MRENVICDSLLDRPDKFSHQIHFSLLSVIIGALKRLLDSNRNFFRHSESLSELSNHFRAKFGVCDMQKVSKSRNKTAKNVLKVQVQTIQMGEFVGKLNVTWDRCFASWSATFTRSRDFRTIFSKFRSFDLKKIWSSCDCSTHCWRSENKSNKY